MQQRNTTMKDYGNYILSITGSDSMGQAGIQADVCTAALLGCQAATVTTSVTVQDERGIQYIHDLPESLIIEQIRSAITSVHPKTAKIGLIRGEQLIRTLRNEIIACRNIVLDPGISSSHGTDIADDATIHAIKQWLIPESTLLMLRCSDAERFLDFRITTDDDMIRAAQVFHHWGAQWVMLRGGQHTENKLTALLYGAGSQQFFSSYNIEGWKRHGVGSALSTAIAVFLSLGKSIPDAISHAHSFIHSQIVYRINAHNANGGARSSEIYNGFLSLIADHYTKAHEVSFYAEKLNISTRYLSQITQRTVCKSPKTIISEYLYNEAIALLSNTPLTIQEISIKLGFTSQAMFCRFFKKVSNNTPSEHRAL